jgi:hypothetical protein
MSLTTSLERLADKAAYAASGAVAIRWGQFRIVVLRLLRLGLVTAMMGEVLEHLAHFNHLLSAQNRGQVALKFLPNLTGLRQSRSQLRLFDVRDSPEDLRAKSATGAIA